VFGNQLVLHRKFALLRVEVGDRVECRQCKRHDRNDEEHGRCEIEKTLDAARDNGLRCWLWLGGRAIIPTPDTDGNRDVLTTIVNHFKGHASLLAWKGIDEPNNPLDDKKFPANDMAEAYKHIKKLDPDHPVLIIHEPLSPAAQLEPYSPAGLLPVRGDAEAVRHEEHSGRCLRPGGHCDRHPRKPGLAFPAVNGSQPSGLDRVLTFSG